MASFKPKQHVTLSIAELGELQGDASQQAIREAVKLTPPFTSTSVVHDNACGAGAVTEAIMDSSPPTGIKIHATDFNPDFVAGTKKIAEEKGWPATLETMDSRALGFEDDLFTHSFTAFAFHCMPGVDQAAKEVYRTVKPGGTAALLIWLDMPHTAAFIEAARKLGPQGTPLPGMLLEDPFTEQDLVRLLKAGGFEDVKTHEVLIKVRLPDLHRWATLGWSYLGKLSGEEQWLESDEEKWDEAIQIVIEEMNKEGRMEKGADGDMYMRLVGCVALAQK